MQTEELLDLVLGLGYQVLQVYPGFRPNQGVSHRRLCPWSGGPAENHGGG
jgi:hypothetical protein